MPSGEDAQETNATVAATDAEAMTADADVRLAGDARLDEATSGALAHEPPGAPDGRDEGELSTAVGETVAETVAERPGATDSDLDGSPSSATDDEPPPPPRLDVDEFDYYAVLGLTPTASAGEIHRAYRRLAKAWHPDRYLLAAPDERFDAERRMRALNRAHATLGDPLLRRQYDYIHAPETALAGTGAPSGWAGGMAPSYVRYGTLPHPEDIDDRPSRVGAALDVGDFFGLLSLVMALGIFAGSMRAAGDSFGIGSALGMLVGAGFFLLAMVSFAHGALLVHAAEERLSGAVDADLGDDAEATGATGAGAGRAGASSAGAGDAPPEDPEEAAAAARFDSLVDEALASIPPSFLRQMPNLLVDVELEPTAEQMRSAHVGHGYTLLGLYVGVPLTAQGMGGATPEHITIFRGPIERHCGGDPDRIRAQVRATVLHEIAHHFGIDHDEMPDWVK